jgi:hypothetical protein
MDQSNINISEIQNITKPSNRQQQRQAAAAEAAAACSHDVTLTRMMVELHCQPRRRRRQRRRPTQQNDMVERRTVSRPRTVDARTGVHLATTRTLRRPMWNPAKTSLRNCQSGPDERHQWSGRQTLFRSANVTWPSTSILRTRRDSCFNPSRKKTSQDSKGQHTRLVSVINDGKTFDFY